MILECAKAALPLATVLADADRGVSIQTESTGSFFLLTSFAGGSGRYVIARQTYRLGGSFKSLSGADIPESKFVRHLRCFMNPLT